MRLHTTPRRRSRRHLYYYLKVFDARSGRLLGNLVNLTAERIQLVISEPVPIDAPWRLRMELPAALEGHADLVLEARSVWCRRDANPACYDACFRLLAVAPDARALFENMISKFGFAG